MNLTEVLNVALPEMPSQAVRVRHPKLHPKLVGREQMERGEPIVNCVISGRSALFRFPPFQWQLLQLFDGERSYEQIAELYFEQTGRRFEPEEIQKMAEELDAADFWYKTPLDQNVTLKQKLNDKRQEQKQKKSKYGDVSHLQFSAWDPDTYLDWVHDRIAFVYSRWFTAITIVGFIFMAYVFATRWSEIGRDTLQFYNFTEKSFYDGVVFWLLACFVLFFHETAHGLTCKHYGGHVHRMGFHLIYFTPAFFTDVTEAWVYADKWQRLATIIAGAWTEMIICAIATPIWWGTPNGTWLHDVAYNLILITGLGVIFFNYNPLIKLDGYYFLTELIEIPDLKEDSTAYASGLVKKYLWRLPVDVPYVPKRRRPWYLLYAFASGVYSYSLLAFFARFVGNVFHNFSPTWAFIPAWLVGLRLFKSRIQTLVKFMKTVYLDKKDRLRAWFTMRRRIAVGAALAFLLAFPWAHDSVEGRFILEPARVSVMRATVPGTIVTVNADEGARVSAGQPILTLRNLQLESEVGKVSADLKTARASAIAAQLRYADFAPAEREQQQLTERGQLLEEQLSQLSIRSPIAGTVLTPRLGDRAGAFVPEGTELAAVGELDQLRARVYVPEFDFRNVGIGARASLHLDTFFGSRSGTVVELAPASAEIAPGLMQQTAYKGIRPPSFYVATIVLDNHSGDLRPGMAGTARILAERRSLAAVGWQAISNFLERKIW